MNYKKKPYVTIFTPTYNRAYIITRLISSLKAQTSKDFEWIVVDDGSTDNTKEVIQEASRNSEFKIRYIWKKNEGKHIAINVGAEKADGKLFFIVDSDDVLVKDAVEKIIQVEKSITDKAVFAGVAGVKGDLSGRPIKSSTEVYSFEEMEQLVGKQIDATPIEYRYKYKITGDRAEVVYTDLIKKIPFPNIDNEKFMEESYLWMTISDMKLKFRWFNSVIYLCEYLDEGLTNNMKDIVKRNWKTHCFCANYDLSLKSIPLKVRAVECLRYYRYGIYGGKSIISLWRECNAKLLSLPAIFLALVYKVK